jgi:hypothetical protein
MSEVPPAYVYTERQAVWSSTVPEVGLQEMCRQSAVRPSRFCASGSCRSLLSLGESANTDTPVSRSRVVDSVAALKRNLHHASLRRPGSNRQKDPESEKNSHPLTQVHPKSASIVAAYSPGDLYFSRIVLPILAWKCAGAIPPSIASMCCLNWLTSIVWTKDLPATSVCRSLYCLSVTNWV